MRAGVVVAEAPAAVDDDEPVDRAVRERAGDGVAGGVERRLVERLGALLVGYQAPAELEDDRGVRGRGVVRVEAE